LNSLIVEDDPTARFILSKWLEKFGSCDAVSSGEEGLEAYKASVENEYPFEFISLDVNMSGMSGLETLEEIRKFEAEKGISLDQRTKILMATSEDKSSTVMASFKGECNGYMTKPFHRKVLVDHLKNMKLIGLPSATVKDRIHTLIVEDDKNTRFILEKWLAEKGRCECADDGRVGLEKFISARESDYPYDLVILDINMPEMNGLDVLKGIRDYEEGLDLESAFATKVIMVTSESKSDMVLKAFGENCDGYLTKPLVKKKMTALLEKLKISS
jgi:two-component system, chemotaxis family, chemotaxis protein CheY